MARSHAARRSPGAPALAAAVALLIASGQAGYATTFPPIAPLSERSAPHSARAQASMARIDGGRYPIGAPAGDARSADDAPAHAVELAAFRIDRTEVTNAAFAEFLNAMSVSPLGVADAGRAAATNFAPGERKYFLESIEPRDALVIALDDDEVRIAIRNGRFAPQPGFDEHPVAETTWAAAVAYCKWRGARLPTEVEWEAAARGARGRIYPWGDATPTPERATIRRRSGDTAKIGSAPRGATPEGVLDLAGSLAEWTSTLYRPYPYRANDGREDPHAAGERVTRGGDYVYQSAPEHLVTWHRRGFSRAPTAGHRHIGFRCAADG